MPLSFKPVQASWVLVTDGTVADLVNHPAVRAAAGGAPQKQFQADAVALAEYHDIQITTLPRAADRFAISVLQVGAPQPGTPLVRVARAAFTAAIEARRPVALGLNFVRRGSSPDGDAGSHLLRVLGPRADALPAAIPGTLTGAGLKLYYAEDDWRATLTLEPAADEPNDIVASVNYHLEPLDLSAPGRDLESLVSQAQTGRLYASFARAVEGVIGGESRVAVH